MAEFIVPLVVQRIADLLIQETASLYGVRDEVERLQAELKRMQCFLKDTYQKDEQDERLVNLIAEIKDIAYDSEDVIETFILRIAYRRGGALTRIFRKAYYLFNIGGEINAIRTRIRDISNSLQTYGIKIDVEREGPSSRFEMQRRLRRSYPHVEEEENTGLESSVADLMARLMEEEERLRVVSIVGMGGLGKTTLAKKVYNHISVRRHFECYAWAFISQQCAIRDVLLGILTKVCAPFKEEREITERLAEEELVERLYNSLKDRRYFVVLDDVWKIEAWDGIKHAFPNGKTGSKILFTTRNREVALHADPWSSPIEPPFLSDEQSWQLLFRKAFPKNVVGNNHRCSTELEKLGREMVRKCGGLPLALVVLGGLLALKRSVSEWEAVQRNINIHLNKFQQNRYGGVQAILALSYHDLPYHLKPCFLYFGHFPEDWDILKEKLIHLWIAEGFVPPPWHDEGEETMEDVAEQYLDDLINRCMVQVGERDPIGRGVKTCRIHDLMRELCVSKAREENFLGIIQQQKGDTRDDVSSIFLLANTKSRRIALHPHLYPCELERYFPSIQGYSHLRSLLCLVKNDAKNLTRSNQEIHIYKKFRLLRVLDLQGVKFLNNRSKLSEEIGNLVHLRYLGLRRTLTTTLPQSLGNLRSLQTLDLRNNRMLTLPDIIWKMDRLRHLLLPDGENGCFRVDTLRNLETLEYIEARNVIRNDGVLRLTNLRHFGVWFESSEEVEIVFESQIVRSNRLRSLDMRPGLESLGISFPSLEPLYQCHDLVELLLWGRLPENLHSQHPLEFLPTSLCKVTLLDTKFKNDPMAVLEKLPNLRILRLGQNSYVGRELSCSCHGFSQLEVLELYGLTDLEEWDVEEGAMPSLRNLHIDRLTSLSTVPEGLKFVTTLGELTIRSMPKSFDDRIRVLDGIEGEDFHKVKHIPSISFLVPFD